MRSRLGRVGAAVLLAAAVAVGACGEDGPTHDADHDADHDTDHDAVLGQATQRVLHRGNDAEVRSLDPHHAAVTSEARILRDMFWSLTEFAADGTVEPAAAKSWEVSDDGLVYTFHLHPGMVWSDGRPHTAHDYVYSVRRILDPATVAEYASMLYPIRNALAVNAGRLPVTELGVAAVDDTTLRFELEQPWPAFPQIFTHPAGAPVPRHVVERHGRGWTAPETIVVNGPFKLVDRVLQSHTALAKNPLFFEADTVRLDRVVYYPIEDDAAGVRRFRSGEIDVLHQFPTAQHDLLKRQLGDQLRVHPYIGSYFYVFNNAVPPFNDARVREALSLAVDRELIITRVLGDIGYLPAYGLVAPGMAGYTPLPGLGAAAVPKAERLDRARRLMAEAGWGPDNPVRFTLSYNTDEDHRKVAVAIARMWAPLGVEATLRNTEASVHFQSLKQKAYEAARSGWIADYATPENFLFLLKSTTRELNYSNYANPAYDALMTRAYTAADPAMRNRLLAEAEALAMRDFPLLPIYYYVSRALVAPHVKGWVDNPPDQHQSRHLTVARGSSVS